VTEKASREQRPRRLLSLGATGLLGGIAVCVTLDPRVGAWVAIAGAVALAVGLHTFGRLGPDAPPAADTRPKPKAKREKARV
jgi:hypothetical protein